MHLSKHQLFLISVPLLLGGVFYFISYMMLIPNMHYLYPNYQEFQAKSLNNKAQIYLTLATKKTLFYTMKENLATRQAATTWMSNALYEKPVQEQEFQSQHSNLTSKTESQVKASPIFKVEAIFPKNNMVIINGKILHLGASINDAQIIQIKNDSVLLQQKKGLKWLYIFK